MAAILDWFMTKVGVLILAVLVVLLAAGLTIQTVRINGISLFGWYAVDGYKPLYEAADRANTTLRTNATTLQSGLDACNASVNDWKAEGDKATAAANAKIRALEAQLAAIKTARGRLASVPGSNAVCPSVDAIFEGAFGQ